MGEWDRAGDRLPGVFDRSRLSPTQRRVARYVADHPREAPFLSSVELAERTGVSQPTVTRLAVALGYGGYAEFQRDLRRAVLGASPEAEGNKFQASVDDEVGNLRALRELLGDEESIKDIGRELAASVPLAVIGLRASAPLAGYFGYFAEKIHPDVRLITDGGSAGTDRLEGGTGNDVVLTKRVALCGNVFEDVNYGGGAGRTKAASSGSGRSGARVELYSSAGVYSTFTTTDASGNYTFLVAPGTYYVRVINSSVTSSRTGYTSSALAVMTYRTDASSGSAVSVTDYVGGTNPAVADPGDGSAGATFNTSTFVYTAVLTGTAQSVAKVVASTSDISGLDFGFNFDTIVNVNDLGQGSLRAFITNANLLANSGLAQSGRTAGIDNAIFMISNGTAAAGLRATGGNGSIRLDSQWSTARAGSRPSIPTPGPAAATGSRSSRAERPTMPRSCWRSIPSSASRRRPP